MKKIIISLAIATMLTACGGLGSSDDVSSQNNGFSVTSISPSANSKIEQNQEFRITFNNNLDPDSIGNVRLLNTTMNIDEPISCTLLDSVSISCIPQRSLELNSKYELILEDSIKNKSENPLNTDTIEYNGKTQPIVSAATPESGNLEPNVNKFTYTFSESMDISTLNTNNVVLKNTTESSDVPLSCNSINNATMSCEITTHLTEGDSYSFKFSSGIKSAENINLESTSFVYNVRNSRYSWDLEYTLPVSGTGMIDYIAWDNGSLYICSNIDNAQPTNTLLAQKTYAGWRDKIISTGWTGNCLSAANGEIYLDNGRNPNTPVYRYSFNNGQLQQIYTVGANNVLYGSPGQIAIILNNLLYTYVSSMYVIGQDYLGIWDGNNSSYRNVAIPENMWTHIYDVNNNMYLFGKNHIYKYNDGNLIDITLQVDNVPDDIKQKYGEYDVWSGTTANSNNMFVYGFDGYFYQYDGVSWIQTSLNIPFGAMDDYPFASAVAATNRYLLYITYKDHLLKRYDLVNHTTDDITPSGLINEQLRHVIVDSNGNIYVTTNKSVYKGSIE